MSYLEALEDGIRIVGENRHSYYIPCEICGREIRRTQYSRKRNYVCDYCKGLIKKKEKASIPKEIESIETKREKRFNKAVENIQKQVKNFSDYDKAINIARTRAELYGSMPEAMVAIELIRLGYQIIPQQKVKNYKVDFAIPKQKIVIEVDGAMYHKDKFNGDREAIIQFSLGFDWKIIHITAEEISKNITKLKRVIQSLYNI